RCAPWERFLAHTADPFPPTLPTAATIAIRTPPLPPSPGETLRPRGFSHRRRDAKSLIYFVARDLDGVLQSLLEILDLSLLPGELPLEFVDAGLDCGSVDSIGDLTGLAVKRLPRLLSVVRHLGDVAVSAAEDDKGAGDSLRDCGHGAPSIDANRG